MGIEVGGKGGKNKKGGKKERISKKKKPPYLKHNRANSVIGGKDNL